MITHETAHKQLTNSFGKTITADMEIGFLSAWQSQSKNVNELLDMLDELNNAVTSCIDLTPELLRSVGVMINEYRSNVQ